MSQGIVSLSESFAKSYLSFHFATVFLDVVAYCHLEVK